MPDFLVRDIEPQVADRIKRIARERRWPINDVILHLIKQALGMAKPEAPLPGDITRLGGNVSADENQVLAEAMKALEQLPDDTPW